jgi:hypothetical protein
MRITVKLVADVIELRCEACQQLLETLPDSRTAYFRAADFIDHLCAEPRHEAAMQERVNPQIGR